MSSTSRSIKNLKAKYAKIAWYRQGAAARPFYLGAPLLACYKPFTVYHKPTPVSYKNLIGYLADGVCEFYHPRPMLARVALFYWRRQQKDPNFINSLKQHWQEHEAKELERIIKKIEKTSLSELSGAGFLRLFQEFTAVYERLWREAIFLDAFDLEGEKILEQALVKTKVKARAGDLSLLTTVTDLSTLQREQQSLLGLAVLIKRNRKLAQAILAGESAKNLKRDWPVFGRQLEQHANSFHWLYNDYAIVRRLDEKFFLDRLRARLAEPDKMKAAAAAIARVKQAPAVKRRLIKELRLPASLINAIDFLVALAVWRDRRKAGNQMASGALRLFAGEAAQRAGWGIEAVEHLFYWEIRSLLSARKSRLHELTTLRRRGMFWTGRPDAATVYYGPAGKKLRQFFNKAVTGGKELSGRPAFPGVARGTVKIVLNQRDFAKMKPGDVLAAHNTRPEFVPVMKLAGAIITEEGGITSHAAIAARELKIPCLVGVQGAVSILRDGDRVEVDAAKGLIKRIV